jgi:protein TonB
MVENGVFLSMPSMPSFFRQPIAVVACVLLFHGLALWALQTGLLQRVMVRGEEGVMPIAVLTEPDSEAKPQALPAPERDKRKPLLQRPPLPLTTAPPAPPAPPTPSATAARSISTPLQLGLAAADVSQSSSGPSTALSAGTALAPVAGATVAAPAYPSNPSAPALKVEWPSSSADYLHNPKPLYPRLSERRNEQGTVILHVLVGADGRVREVGVKSSSGFERLDQAAREAVLDWTFVPGKRNGAAVEMAVDVPIRFKPSE